MRVRATFNNISVISWGSVLLVEETWIPGENHQPAGSHWQTLSHNVVSSTHRLRMMKNLKSIIILTWLPMATSGSFKRYVFVRWEECEINSSLNWINNLHTSDFDSTIIYYFYRSYFPFRQAKVSSFM